MCPPKKSRIRIPKKSIQVELTDEWDPELLQAVGALLIACAQLEWQVFIVAKRKDGRGLLKWLADNPEQRFTGYACWLERSYPSDESLMRAVSRARKIWERRNGYVHAVWCLYNARRYRRRNFHNYPISIPAIHRLTISACAARDRLNKF